MQFVQEMLAIEIKDLSYSYPDGYKALDGVNLTVQAGEKVAIVGPNGAGKSTLLMHLNGLFRGQGSVTVMGVSIENGDGKSLAKARAIVGMVFQDPDDQLFSPTVFEDVAFGPIYMGLSKSEVEKRVAAALADVGLEGYEERMPNHLSAGEKKRIAIATVLSMQPRVLALDEPSSSLDPRARRELIKLLDVLPQTMIVATHDLRLVKEVFPRTCIIDKGKIVTDDTTESILSDIRLLEAHGLESL